MKNITLSADPVLLELTAFTEPGYYCLPSRQFSACDNPLVKQTKPKGSWLNLIRCDFIDKEDVESLKSLLNKNPSIRCLNLLGCEFFENEGTPQKFYEFLKEINVDNVNAYKCGFPKIAFHPSGMDFSGDLIISSIAKNLNLKVVNFANNYLTMQPNTFVESIKEMHQTKNITHVDFKNNIIFADCGLELCKFIEKVADVCDGSITVGIPYLDDTSRDINCLPYSKKEVESIEKGIKKNVTCFTDDEVKVIKEYCNLAEFIETVREESDENKFKDKVTLYVNDVVERHLKEETVCYVDTDGKKQFDLKYPLSDQWTRGYFLELLSKFRKGAFKWHEEKKEEELKTTTKTTTKFDFYSSKNCLNNSDGFFQVDSTGLKK